MKRTIMLAAPAALLLMAVLLGGPAGGSAQAHPSTFPDVAETDVAHVAVEALAAKNIITGNASGEFLPNDPVTRAQAAKILAVWQGVEATSGGAHFADVDETAAPYVEAALARGWINGYPDGSFRPYDPLSRQQMAVMAIRSLGLADEALALSDDQIDETLAAFTDQGAISPAARPQLALAVMKGLIGGSKHRLNPVNRVTRAQFSLVIYRADIVAQGGTIVATATDEPSDDDASPEEGLTAAEQAEAAFMDTYLFRPHNSPISGEMVLQNEKWYGIPALSQLVIMAAETSLGDPKLGGSLARHYNFGCLRYHGDSTPWGLLADGKIWIAGKDWYSFATPQIGMVAFGRYLKAGVNGFYAPILSATHPNWEKFAGIYFGRNVPGLDDYIGLLHNLENRFRSMAAARDVTL